MRFMVIVKANEESEAGVLPDEKILAAMGKYNEELVKAGVMLAGEGLHPSSKGVRVRFDGGKRTVTDGPFSETKELIAGFWLWQVKSKEEAVEGLKRAPFDGGKRTVTDGPFSETKELIAGFWLWQVKSKEEAVEWLKRAPFDGGTEIELRQIFEAEDIGAELSAER